jgi:hypothetical protein
VSLPRSIAAGAALIAALLGTLACSTFSGSEDPVPAGGGDEGGGADGASALDSSLADGGLVDAPPPAVDAAHDARFSLSCGTQTCMVSGDGCCRDRGMTAPAGFACAPAKDVCPVSGDLRFTCDDNDDCTVLGFPGTVCCGALGSLGNNYFLMTTTCALAENCVGASDIRLCDRTVGGECPTGKPCIDLKAFPKPDDAGGTWAIDPSVAACEP